jgi:succinyldiaminopimelate transaminase
MGFADLRTLAYPWDTLTDVRATARAHPGGMVDLSIGTPVDPTPDVVRDALTAASDAPAYPLTHGTPALRETVAAWFERRRGVPGLDPAGVLPTLGSKELVGLLPSLLRLGPGDVVVHPRVAYPTYDVGARLAGATPLPADDVADWAGRGDVRLVWVNSPSNPTGAVAGVERLREVVDAARAAGAVVVSDECYAELPWAQPWTSPDGRSRVPSLLDPRVTGGSTEGLLVAYSLSKQSNVAGYRAAFVAGDPALVSDLLATRKHLGMIVPAPVQAAMVAALSDDAHVEKQRDVYGRRRAALLPALEAAGYAVDHSEAGLYLWVRPADRADAVSSRDLARRFAERGILVGPGEFYGAAGEGHVRVALTAPDDAVAAAVARITSS